MKQLCKTVELHSRGGGNLNLRWNCTQCMEEGGGEPPLPLIRGGVRALCRLRDSVRYEMLLVGVVW